MIAIVALLFNESEAVKLAMRNKYIEAGALDNMEVPAALLRKGSI